MRINDDTSCSVIVHAARQEWVASPAAGVHRRMLFRIGNEVARATSIVDYDPGSAFAPHIHAGGEEMLILDGVFQDEHGAYPAGSYLRNPPGTSHVPASREGCTIFVRLWQFRDGDDAHVVRRPGDGRNLDPRPGAAAATVLFDDSYEDIRLEDWKPGGRVTVENTRGLELLVLAGGFQILGEQLEPHSWVRLPPGIHIVAHVGPSGARIWMKDAPLLHPDVRRIPEA
jgi:hypothetical protein